MKTAEELLAEERRYQDEILRLRREMRAAMLGLRNAAGGPGVPGFEQACRIVADDLERALQGGTP